jgi:protein gp37
MEFSNIECWHTFNPWIGRQRVSPGCDHCDAGTQNKSRKCDGGAWGANAPRKRTSERYWRKPLRWDREAKAGRKQARVFCASLADWLDNKAPEGAREELAEVIFQTPSLDWLLLTKRIENFRTLSPWGTARLPANVWISVASVSSVTC